MALESLKATNVQHPPHEAAGASGVFRQMSLVKANKVTAAEVSIYCSRVVYARCA